MTNADKYEEVFGFPPVMSDCPTSDCKKCPFRKIPKGQWWCSSQEDLYNWWQSEYKEKK